MTAKADRSPARATRSPVRASSASTGIASIIRRHVVSTRRLLAKALGKGKT
jgi:hypothetical protein